MATKTNKLIVSDISNTLFVIPYYQRGYRWTGKNVKQLLNDLLLFANGENDDNEYCLQPIVLQKISKESYLHVALVAKKDYSVIRVVDGQQRLTTLEKKKKKLSIPTEWDIYYDSEKKNLSEIFDVCVKNNSINDYFRTEVSDAVDEFISNNEVKGNLSGNIQTIEFYDSENNRTVYLGLDTDGNLKVSSSSGIVNFYATGGVSSLGSNSGSGGGVSPSEGASLDAVWNSLGSSTGNYSNRKIAIEHIPSLPYLPNTKDGATF